MAASYRRACALVALNDNPGSGDSPEDIAGYVTVGLVADIWDKTSAEVAQAVAKIRRAEGLPVGASDTE